ncbi:c-type cytochrome [Faunimonas sp. B44]
MGRARMIPRWLAFAAVAATVVAGLALWQKRTDPEGLPDMLAGSPDLQESGEPIPSEAGAALFAQNCAACHGADAFGTDRGPPLVHRIYEPSHHSDEAFLVAMLLGVRQHHWTFGSMPPVEGLTEPEARTIVAHLRALQRANGIH